MPDKRKVVPIADPAESLFAAAEEAAESQHIERDLAIPGVKLGTSAFTAAGWPGSFYPASTRLHWCCEATRGFPALAARDTVRSDYNELHIHPAFG